MWKVFDECDCQLLNYQGMAVGKIAQSLVFCQNPLRLNKIKNENKKKEIFALRLVTE